MMLSMDLLAIEFRLHDEIPDILLVRIVWTSHSVIVFTMRKVVPSSTTSTTATTTPTTCSSNSTSTLLRLTTSLLLQLHALHLPLQLHLRLIGPTGDALLSVISVFFTPTSSSSTIKAPNLSSSLWDIVNLKFVAVIPVLTFPAVESRYW